MSKINMSISLLTAVVLVLVLATVLPLAAGKPVPAAVADGSGIIKPVKLQTLANGTTGYSVTSPISSLYSSTAYVGDFGAVQFQIAAQVTGSQVVTWTPQFSIQPITGNCNNSTAWFDAVSYQTYTTTPYPTATYVSPVPYWWEQVIFSAKTTGAMQVGFEAQTVGQCVRLRYEIDTAEVMITPTIYLRALNRQ